MATIIQFPKAISKQAPDAKATPVKTWPLALETPIMKQAHFFLLHAAKESGIKLTERGNLNRAIVQEFWKEHLDENESPFLPQREEDCWEISRIAFLLKEAGYVKKLKRKILITQKGEAVLHSGMNVGLYRDLLKATIDEWEWGYGDRYPDYDFIQESFGSFVNVLWGSKDRKINALELFHKTFEINATEIGSKESRTVQVEPDFNNEPDFDTDLHRMMLCTQLRFMQRFCVPFGLLKRPDSKNFLIALSEQFEKTDFLFNELHDIACPLIHGQH